MLVDLKKINTKDGNIGTNSGNRGQYLLGNIGLWSDELIYTPSETQNIYLISGNKISLNF